MKTNVAPATPQIFTARFKDMKVTGEYSTHTVNGLFEIQLRPIAGAPHLFTVHFANHARAVSSRPRTLQQAKESARLLFLEQITEWRVLDPPA